MALSTESNSRNDPVSAGTQWGSTHSKLVKFSYIWTVDNFSFCFENVGNLVTSPTFITEECDNVSWCIDLYPMGKSTEDNGFISLYLRLYTSYKNQVKARVHLWLLNSEQEKITLVLSPQTIIFSTVSNLYSNHVPNSVTQYGASKCFAVSSLLDKTKNLLPDDKLTIHCKLLIVNERIHTKGHGNSPQFNIQRRCISDDLSKLLEEMKLSDVTLVAGGKEIQAHKLILASRSAVFAVMFEHDMQEQKLSRVDITDVDHDVLTEMLSFIYKDCAPNLDKMAADLLAAADKYALDSLKVLCEEALYKELSVESAVDTLVLADLHSAAQLKEHTIAFIKSGRAAAVMETEGWKNMIITHQHLVTELIKTISL